MLGKRPTSLTASTRGGPSGASGLGTSALRSASVVVLEQPTEAFIGQDIAVANCSVAMDPFVAEAVGCTNSADASNQGAAELVGNIRAR